MRRALLLSALAGLFACGISARGLLTNPDGTGDSDDAGSDSRLGVGAREADADAAADASVGDADADAGCAPLPAATDGGGRTANVPPTTSPGSCPTIVLDAPSAAKVVGAPLASARVYLTWEAAALHVVADVTDPLLEGTDPTEPYDNDSLEIYVSSNPLRTGDYGLTEHHYIIDHNGVAIDYSNLSAPTPMSDVSVVKTGAGYRVEMKVMASSAFGTTLFAGQTLYFDVLLNDGIAQATYLVWATEPHADCPFCVSCTCNFSPAYDTLLFSPIMLQ